MIVHVLSFDGCPNRDLAFERVRAALEEEGVAAEVVEILVADHREVRRMRFLGSPSIRIDGLDVEPAARASRAYGMVCRTYRDGDTVEGAPSTDAIREAIRFATRSPDASRRPHGAGSSRSR